MATGGAWLAPRPTDGGAAHCPPLSKPYRPQLDRQLYPQLYPQLKPQLYPQLSPSSPLPLPLVVGVWSSLPSLLCNEPAGGGPV